MIAYKSTDNFKCIDLIYEIGKTYTISKLQMCEIGFHFCKNIRDVLRYYEPSKDFKLLEVEILGDVIDSVDKSVTNKLKVLREIPASEHKLFEVDSNFKTFGPFFTPDETYSIAVECDKFCLRGPLKTLKKKHSKLQVNIS